VGDQVYSSDNSGNRIPVHPLAANPVAASGLTKTLTTANTNYTLTVEAGAVYRIVGWVDGAITLPDLIFASITGTAVTNANKEWVFPLSTVGIIKIPAGVTTLNLTATADSVVVYLAKLDI